MCRRLKYLHGQIERYCAESLDYLWSNTKKIGRRGERARGDGWKIATIQRSSATLDTELELRPAHRHLPAPRRRVPFPASNAITDVAELFGFETEHNGIRVRLGNGTTPATTTLSLVVHIKLNGFANAAFRSTPSCLATLLLLRLLRPPTLLSVLN
ncbi:Uncharacterized protein DBV15_10935 [Temnothorax longispinosus]|uniref:Uncharacterized protein n=1 Tax=Temnothorax longispinosus TaxID=300112 RepID=A0A4S2KGB9_9HYME|nr:Uncharacterized protein DBV15_10935 [Temnothorax longispinosus]